MSVRAARKQCLWMVVAFALTHAVALAASSAERISVETRAFDIDKKALATALHEFSTQADADVISSSDLVEGKSSNRVYGTMTPAAALKTLLGGTGLEMVEREDGSFVLIQARKIPSSAVGVSAKQYF